MPPSGDFGLDGLLPTMRRRHGAFGARTALTAMTTAASSRPPKARPAPAQAGS